MHFFFKKYLRGSNSKFTVASQASHHQFSILRNFVATPDPHRTFSNFPDPVMLLFFRLFIILFYFGFSLCSLVFLLTPLPSLTQSISHIYQ